MQHRKRTKVTAALLALCMLVSLLPVTAFGLDPQSAELGKGSTIDGTGYHVTSVKNYSIAPDISERVIITNNDAGNSQTVANVMEVNTSGGRAKIVAGYGNRNPKEQGWTLKTTTDQAHVYEKESGLNVVGGVNASWFNINTGEPSGYLVMNGVVHHDNSSRAFIAAFDDGSVNVFREGTTLAQAEADQSAKQGKTVKILEAVDALVAMVWDGKVVITESGNSGYYPRTCVGIKADGTVVLFQADGTMAPRSVGYTAAEEARMMVALGCVAALLVLVIVLENTMQPTSMLFTVLKKGAVYALVAASLNLLNGFTGLFSLGQAGFMLLGAYTYAILTIPSADRESVYYLYGGSAVNFSLPELFGGGALGLILGVLAALILAGCVAAVIAWLIGLPVLRLKSDYLAIATLGFAEIIRAIFQWDRLGPVTNGANALKSFPTFSSFNIENANGEVVLRLSTFVPFLLVAVCIGIMVLLINSTYGRAFKAIREDEVAAEAMGINLAKHKRMAFCISSFFAGVGGGLFAMFANQAQAKTFTTSMTYEILLIVVIGGIGSISGSCIASFLYVAASEWWLRFLDTETYIGAFKVPFLRTGFRMVVFSIIIMIVVLFFRRGLMGDRELSDVARSLRARLSGKSKKKEAAK